MVSIAGRRRPNTFKNVRKNVVSQGGAQLNIIALHFHYGLSQLMLYPVVCARTFQSARCELLVPNQHSPGE